MEERVGKALFYLQVLNPSTETYFFSVVLTFAWIFKIGKQNQFRLRKIKRRQVTQNAITLPHLTAIQNHQDQRQMIRGKKYLVTINYKKVHADCWRTCCKIYQLYIYQFFSLMNISSYLLHLLCFISLHFRLKCHISSRVQYST